MSDIENYLKEIKYHAVLAARGWDEVAEVWKEYPGDFPLQEFIDTLIKVRDSIPENFRSVAIFNLKSPDSCECCGPSGGGASITYKTGKKISK